MSDSFPQVEYDAFIFESDSMHELLNKEKFQFQSNMFECADRNFQNEQVVENEAGCYMHYGSEVVDSVLPSELIQNVDLIGEIDRRSNNSLPHASSYENHIYERGKQFC